MWNNAKGMSFVEVIVAIGLTGGISLGVMKLTDTSQKQNVFAKQAIVMDDYIRGLRDFISDKQNCDMVLSGSGSTISVDLTPYHNSKSITTGKISAISSMGVDTSLTKVLLPERTTGRQVLPVSIYIYFDRNLNETFNNSATGKPVKKTTANVIFEDNNFVECSDYESEAERSAFQLACETLGGVIVDSDAKELECDYSQIPADHKFLVNAKERVCRFVYGGQWDENSGKCTSLNMDMANFYGGNIQPNSIDIGTGKLSTLNQTCSGANTFVRGFNADGSPVCAKITRCSRGDPGCP